MSDTIIIDEASDYAIDADDLVVAVSADPILDAAKEAEANLRAKVHAGGRYSLRALLSSCALGRVHPDRMRPTRWQRIGHAIQLEAALNLMCERSGLTDLSERRRMRSVLGLGIAEQSMLHGPGVGRPIGLIKS